MSVQLPSLAQTQRGVEWLRQFTASEQEAAEKLVSSIRIATRNDVESGLYGLISRLGVGVKGASAIFAVRELPEPTAVQTDGGDLEFVPRTYFPLDDSARPDIIWRGKGVGSEGPIANLIRDICRANGSSRWLDHPSIQQMRATRTRRIVLVDDMIGSGDRIRKFMDGFMNNKSIRSWYSYKRFSIVVVSFAAHVVALRKLARSRFKPAFENCVILPNGSPEWTQGERRAIESLCVKYAHLTSRPSYPLGYRSTFSCFTFDYKCPNTTPAIIWAGSSNWKSLIDQRPRLRESQLPCETGAGDRTGRVLRAHGAERIAQGFEIAQLSESEQLAICALALCSRGRKQRERLAENLGISDAGAESILARLHGRGLLSASGRLTDNGRAELKRLKKLGRDKSASDGMKELRYYVPRSLRSSND